MPWLLHPFRMLLASMLICSTSLALTSASTATEISSRERRIDERPEDFIALTRLGQLYIRQAHETGDLTRYGKAETLFRKALELFPDHTGAVIGLASASMALHRFGDARDVAQKILGRNPKNIEARLLAGDAELALGYDQVAAKIFEQLPDLPATFSRRADLARLHGDNDATLKLALRAADEAEARGEAPENICWYRVRAGEIFFRTGKLEDAETQYRLGAERWPESFQAAEHFAELRGAQEKFADAETLYQKLLAQSDRPDIHQAMGDLYLFMHKTERAKTSHDRALAGYLASIERGEMHFIHHLSGFYADDGEDGNEAVKWARKDLEMRQTPAAHEALAWALYRAGAFAESRDAINQALAGGIKDAHIFFHAGMIFCAAGDLERGQQFLHETQELNPLYNRFHVHR